MIHPILCPAYHFVPFLVHSESAYYTIFLNEGTSLGSTPQLPLQQLCPEPLAWQACGQGQGLGGISRLRGCVPAGRRPWLPWLFEVISHPEIPCTFRMTMKWPAILTLLISSISPSGRKMPSCPGKSQSLEKLGLCVSNSVLTSSLHSELFKQQQEQADHPTNPQLTFQEAAGAFTVQYAVFLSPVPLQMLISVPGTCCLHPVICNPRLAPFTHTHARAHTHTDLLLH